MAMEGFLKGFTQQQLSPQGYLGGKLEDQQKRRQNLLELSMLSRKLEQEAAIKRLSPNVSGFIASNAGLPLQDGQQLSPDEASNLNSVYRSNNALQGRLHGRQFRPIKEREVIDGNIVIRYRNPATFKVEHEEVMGLDPVMERKAREAIASFAPADRILQRIDQDVKKIYTAYDLTSLAQQYGSVQLNRLIQERPEVKAFFSVIDASTPQLIKAMGDSGALTVSDRIEMKNALPQPTDTLATAIAKIDNLRDVFDNIVDSKTRAYRTGRMPGERPPKEEGKPLGERMGGSKKPVSQAAKNLAAELGY